MEMSCPWMDNRLKKTEEKTAKYGPLRWEMAQQYPGYTFKQHNIVIDVLGAWSRDVDVSMIELLGGLGRGDPKKNAESYPFEHLEHFKNF